MKIKKIMAFTLSLMLLMSILSTNVCAQTPVMEEDEIIIGTTEETSQRISSFDSALFDFKKIVFDLQGEEVFIEDSFLVNITDTALNEKYFGKVSNDGLFVTLGVKTYVFEFMSTPKYEFQSISYNALPSEVTISTQDNKVTITIDSEFTDYTEINLQANYKEISNSNKKGYSAFISLDNSFIVRPRRIQI